MQKSANETAQLILQRIPVLPFFSLFLHKSVWVNVVNAAMYKYETDLRERLVLPKSHSRLIDALVRNLDALKMESENEERSQILSSKSSSSIILAKGPAGTGKTLTSEVYAEEIQRPLYEVAAGQIGTNAEQIEENLTVILNRAVRLRMPLLINEADVFIQKRGRDLNQNAVVSVMLRLLEYHNGLVWLTTNRSDDIDDAILSRCIAEIEYLLPEQEERRRLWEIQTNEFNVKLSTKSLDKAALVFPKVSGRDIMQLVRLTTRVNLALGEKFSLKTLKECAMFRSIKVEENVDVTPGDKDD